MKALGIFFACLVLFVACSGDNSVSNNNLNGNGMLKVFMTDGPIQLKEVWVTITNIEVHKTGQAWMSLGTSSKTVDLLTLKNRQELLQSSPLSPGTYTDIRLFVSEGHIIDMDGNRCDLKIPSGKIEIPMNFKIAQGKETDAVLDFSADKSIHVVSAGHSDKCIMRPVILVKSVSEPT